MVYQLRYLEDGDYGLWDMELNECVARGFDPITVLASYYADMQAMMRLYIYQVIKYMEYRPGTTIVLVPMVAGSMDVSVFEGIYVAQEPVSYS